MRRPASVPGRWSLAFLLLLLAVGPSACSRPSRPRLQTRTWKDQQVYVWVPPGRFEMGCVPGDQDCGDDERPRHAVTLARGFWMARTEMPIGVYDAYAVAAGLNRPMVPWGRPRGGDRMAAAAISWEEATAYCASIWARLPTEAEWEYAARAGHEGWKYVWGADGPPLRGGRPLANLMDLAALREDQSMAVFTQGFEGYDDGYAVVSPVAAFPANDFGLYDMDGNVNEWCQDRWHENYGGAPDDGRIHEGGAFHVLRGGSWTTGRRQARISSRLQHGFGTNMSGFRCVLDPD